MIRRRRSTAACPASLDGPESPGGRELAKNTGASTMTFSAYSRPDVKDALETIFAKKCAYCETRYDRSGPIDVEHFRPKSEVVVAGGGRSEGYWWLAAEWDNLLPSCIDCNRARTQDFEGDQVGTAVRGKANQFPLDDERHRATTPQDFAGGKETGHRLLIDPCRDEPEAHLVFSVNGTVRSRSTKGRESIAVFALDRQGLNEGRRRHATDIAQRLRDVRFYVDEFDQGNQAAGQRLDEILDELGAKGDDDAEYAALSRTILAELHTALQEDRLHEYLTEVFTELGEP
jgi:uncharacterized protein (TIGR02646 family)